VAHKARLAVLTGISILGAVYVTLGGGGAQTLGDYGSEAAPAMNALLAGHLHAFLNGIGDSLSGNSWRL